MTKTFEEVISGIRKAKKGVEVREDLAQMGEYCQQFTQEAGTRADAAKAAAETAATNAKASEKKATDAVAGIEQTKADAVQAVQQAKTTATDAVQQAQTAATDAVTTKQTEAVQAVDDERDAALQQVADSTQAAQTAASNAAASEQAAQANKEAAATSAGAAANSATAASGSASAAATSESNAATSAENANTDADRAEAAAELAGTRANTDKTLTVSGAPADAAAAGKALGKKLDLTGGTMTGPLILPGGGSALGIEDNAATHNMIYRGKYLGSSVTSEQWAAIAAGTFKDLYLGDYWPINGMDYLIVGFNYWLNTGDTPCTKHHLLVVPRNNLYSAVMNSTNTTAGGYVGSEMYKTGLAHAKTTINSAFGSAHILNHRQLLVNAVTNGAPTGNDWYDSTVELMNENMVYGNRQFSPMSNSEALVQNYIIDKSQLPLFRLAPWLICNQTWYWLRDPANTTYFTSVSANGSADRGNASDINGVRPVFGLIG